MCPVIYRLRGPAIMQAPLNATGATFSVQVVGPQVNHAGPRNPECVKSQALGWLEEIE